MSKAKHFGWEGADQKCPSWEGYGYLLEQQNGYANEHMKDKIQRLPYNVISKVS